MFEKEFPNGNKTIFTTKRPPDVIYNLCLVFWSVVLNRQFSQASLNLSMTFQLSFVACQRLRKISLPQEKRQNRKMKVPSFVKSVPGPFVSSLFTL